MTTLFFGILQGWSITSPWSGHALWWLQLVALAWLVRRLLHIQPTRITQRPPPATPAVKAACRTSFLFALAWFVSSMWWLYTSMHVYGGLAAPLAALGVVALCSVLASFYAVAGAGFVWLRIGKAWFDSLLFSALWLIAELARGCVMTGLPWNAIGYAHIDGPLISAAPWVGVYGISALAALIAALFVLTRSCALKLLVVLVLVIKAHLMPDLQALHSKASEPASPAGLTIRLLQGSIPQNEKFNEQTGALKALAWYKNQLLAAAQDRVDVVITPETAMPFFQEQLPPGYWTELQAAFVDNPINPSSAALIGMPLLMDASGHYANSVLALQAGDASRAAKTPYAYHKHHLVPFGEFVPPLFRWLVDLMHIPLGEFKAGGFNQPSFSHAGERLAINICFEDLFGEELATRFIDPRQAPTIFVNVSNMAWFGDGMAIDQHLNVSRMRALEFQRPMIRATNTGATVVINQHGVVTHQLPRSTPGTLSATIQGQTQITPYAQWAAHLGLQPLWALACAWVILALVRKKHLGSASASVIA